MAATVLTGALAAGPGAYVIAETPPDPVTEAPVVVDPPGIYGANPAQRAIIEQSMLRFRESGLPLPALRIYVHTGREGCNGAAGLFRKDGDPERIDICSEIRSHLKVLHELAHAWAHHSLPEPTKQAFLDDTGLVWYDPEIEWQDRGVEAVASAIAWGLMPDVPLSPKDLSEHNRELAHRFELLTGMTPPRLV